MNNALKTPPLFIYCQNKLPALTPLSAVHSALLQINPLDGARHCYCANANKKSLAISSKNKWIYAWNTNKPNKDRNPCSGINRWRSICSLFCFDLGLTGFVFFWYNLNKNGWNRHIYTASACSWRAKSIIKAKRVWSRPTLHVIR